MAAPRFHITDLPVNDVKALVALLQQNFEDLRGFILEQPLLNGEFRHCEITLDKAVTDYKFQHRLNFIPKDVIQTFLTEGVTLTWAYDHFDRTNIQLTTSAPCTVRFLVGRYDAKTGVA